MSLFAGLAFLLFALVILPYVRDLLNPAVVYLGSWGLTLLGIGLATGFGYFEVSADAVLVFAVGAAAFVAGALSMGRASQHPDRRVFREINYRKVVWFSLLVHLLVVPLAIADIRSITSGAEDLLQVAFRLRIDSVTGEQTVGTVTGNYIVLGLIIIPIMMAGVVMNRLSGLLALSVALPWILLGLLVSGRVGAITLAFSCLYIFFVLGGRLTIKAISGFGVFLVLMLVAGNLLVGKIEAEFGDGVKDILGQSIKGFFDYFFAGPILFSRYLEDPTSIIPTWDALIFPCQVLEKIGACTVPLIHQEFLPINTGGDLGNVYSIVFSTFPKYGFLGTVVIMFFYGVAAGYFHARRCSGLFSLLISSYLFYATILSIYLDGFGNSAYFFIKVFVVVFLIKNVFSMKNESIAPRTSALV
jgi:oligosaccharide repeat unit polymerase